MNSSIRSKSARIINLEDYNDSSKQSNFLAGKLILKTRQSIDILDWQSLVYLQAESNYTRIFLEDGRKFLGSKPLKFYANQIQDVDFIRVHQSYLVNLKQLKSISFSSGMRLLLSNGTYIPVSRKNHKRILDLF